MGETVKVEMYTAAGCGYCTGAKSLLERKGIPYTEIRVDIETGRRAEMVQRAAGLTSVPQIFIDDRHVGGFDDMVELDVDGELDPLLGLA